jgi:hypothetical protein
MHWTFRKDQGRMDLETEFLGNLDMPSDVIQVIQAIKDDDSLNTALLQTLNQELNGIIGKPTPSEGAATPDQDLEIRFGHEFS